MASQLRRTFHRSVLYSALMGCLLIGCNTPAKDKKKSILQEFEGINEEIANIDTLLYPSDALYDSLMLKAWNHFPTQQMYYHVNDFLYGYSADLRSRFESFVSKNGMDSVELSAKFFNEKRNDPEDFFSVLHSATGRLESFTRDTFKHREIDNIIQLTPLNKAKSLFTTAPPAAIISIIKYYQYKLKEITIKVLNEYFKNL